MHLEPFSTTEGFCVIATQQTAVSGYAMASTGLAIKP